jgi:ABC-type transport system involved in multi-copper enzyme maturation permease subunit
MKYIAILRDSLRETIDSKVFFVVIAIALLAVFLMATISLEPNPAEQGLQKVADRFPDGSDEVTLPVVGKIKATPALTQYTVMDVKGPEGKKPWEGEYSFTVESRDQQPLGGRIAVFRYVLAKEERQERSEKTGKKTRLRQLEEDVRDEAQRIEERETKKGRDRLETQKRIQEQIIVFLVKRLEDEVRGLKPAEMEDFVREQLASQGNWRVTEVKWLELPPEERTIKIKTKVPIQEGDDVRITTEEADGEVNRFAVKVAPEASTYRAWPHKATLLFGAIPMGSASLPGELVSTISHRVVGVFGAPIIMLLGCIITAFFIPNMLRKGTIDLLLAKPVSRVGLLTYKYIGGLTFMLLNTVVLVLGLWLALGLRTGVWETSFLYMVPVLTFEFALFYAVSTLAAVLTRSPIVSILGCVLLWGLLFGVGWLYWLAQMTTVEGQGRVAPSWAYTTVDTAHTALPHYLDLDWLADRSLLENTLPAAEKPRIEREYGMFRWGETLAVTSVYILLFLGLAVWRFAVKDY